MAGGLLESASELSQQAELMNREVGNFLVARARRLTSSVVGDANSAAVRVARLQQPRYPRSGMR